MNVSFEAYGDNLKIHLQLEVTVQQEALERRTFFCLQSADISDMEIRKLITELKYGSTHVILVHVFIIFIMTLVGVNFFLESSLTFIDYCVLAIIAFVWLRTTVRLFSELIWKREIKIFEDGIQFRLHPYFPFKTIYMKYEEINFIRCITANERKIELRSIHSSVTINVYAMSSEGSQFLLRSLEKNLKHFREPLPTLGLHRVRKEEEDFPSFYRLLAIYTLIPLFLSTYFFSDMEDYQLEHGHGFPIFMFSLFLGILLKKWFFKRYPLHMRRNQVRANFISLAVGFAVLFTMTPIATSLNQSFDSSKPALRIVNLTKASESASYERENGPCYYLDDEYLKKADIEHRLCTKKFSQVNENSRALIAVKKGFMGQRWIASIKVID